MMSTTVDLEVIKECLGVYVKYDTHIGRQLANYLDIESELKSVRLMSEYYTRKQKHFIEKYVDESDPSRAIEEDDVVPITGVFTNIIMAYSRCFDTARKQEGKPSRRIIKLNSSFLKGADAAVLDLHNKLMNIRNEMVAHAGVNGIERFECVIGLDLKGNSEIKPSDDNCRVVSNPYVEIDKMDSLLAILSKEVNEKIALLLEKAQLELNMLDRKGALFIKKIHARQAITDADLK